jgi:hypothetical protein
MNSNDIYALVGCEESQAVTIELRKLGIKAFSCDLKPCSGGHPEWHLQCDVFLALEAGVIATQSGETVDVPQWNLGIFFPDCTYLTCSAEWAYKDPDHVRYPGVGYHQKVKAETLTGEARRRARADAFEFFTALYNCGIKHIGMENPIGVMSKYVKPTQIIHPFMFGDDASKSTCIWTKNLPKLTYTDDQYFRPREVWNQQKGDYDLRWSNQTDSGQNKLPPSDKRAELRSKTYPGIAKAMAAQWGGYVRNKY